MGLKVTRKMLNDYRETKQLIPLLEFELEEMKHGDSGLGNSVILDYRTGEGRPQSVVGRDQKRYDRREKELNKKKAECKAVEEWIEAIQDGLTRQVFKMFYINGLTWDKVAVATGYANSLDYPRLHIRDDYLKKCEIR